MSYNTYPQNPFPPNSEDAGGGESYVLPIASANDLGGVKVGSNLTIDANGALSAPAPTPAYELPVASAETLGGVKGGGDYIAINESGVVSVNKSLPYVGNSYKITSYDTSGEAKIKVTKYDGETVVSETIVDHHDVSQPRVFDDRFSIQYSSNWIYKNLVASNDHPANWTKTWGFDQTQNFTERFDNSGDTLAMVKQVDAIKNAIISASSFTDAQSKLAQL